MSRDVVRSQTLDRVSNTIRGRTSKPMPRKVARGSFVDRNQQRRVVLERCRREAHVSESDRPPLESNFDSAVPDRQETLDDLEREARRAFDALRRAVARGRSLASNFAAVEGGAPLPFVDAYRIRNEACAWERVT